MYPGTNYYDEPNINTLMYNFVKIFSLFSNLSERNIAYLSKLYQDKVFIYDILSKLSSETLIPSSFQSKKILLKPNWVKHNSKPLDHICLCTHTNFILAVLEFILSLRPERVTIADAPIQSCKWNEIVTDDFVLSVRNLSEKYNVPVYIKDFRRSTFIISKNKLETDLKPLSEYIIFNTGKNSFLEPITREGKSKFRVTNYDPERLSTSHKPGIHKYCITRELFDADIIISLPKIKTHQKTGITGAIKNIVGFNGDKDFLPHHRMGGTEKGGDCYPGGNNLRYLSEMIRDQANRHRGKFGYSTLVRIASLFWKLSIPRAIHTIEGGWWGNDTAWRMVLDLNKIVYFGKSDGTISDKPQRRVFSFCDGIIAGQGDGPLNPEPLPLGVVSFTDNPAANDIAMVTLMGFDYKRFPVLSESLKLFSINDCDIIFNDEKIDLKSLKNYSVQTQPPPGWREYLLVK